MSRLTTYSLAAVMALLGCTAQAITLDGVGIPSEGLPLLATQNSPTSFGDSTGTQASTGGSELNQIFGSISGNKLTLGITGNLEANYNKLWIFFDAVSGGESTLLGDNQSGGYNQITALQNVTFQNGGIDLATMDHGLVFEVGVDGGPSHAVNFFDLITNTATQVVSGGGFNTFPLSSEGGPKGVTLGWNNSNSQGVTGGGGSAATADTATTGWELEIDIPLAFNGSQGNINVTAFITSGNGSFLSNQVLPGVGVSGETQLGNPPVTLPFLTISGPVIGGALPGDVDGDGDVDLEELIANGDGISDFDIIRMNWLETNATFGSILTRADGDLNENGEVGIEDFREWKNAFNGTPEQIAAAFASLGTTRVPEPTTLVFSVLGGVALLVVRRRSR